MNVLRYQLTAGAILLIAILIIHFGSFPTRTNLLSGHGRNTNWIIAVTKLNLTDDKIYISNIPISLWTEDSRIK